MSDYLVEHLPSEAVVVHIGGTRISDYEVNRHWRKVYWFVPGVFVFSYHYWTPTVVLTLEEAPQTGQPVHMVYSTTWG